MFYLMNIMIADIAGAGQALRARRHELGLSQAELATAAGLTRARLSQLEHGRANVSLRSYLRLAQALGAGLYLEPATGRPTLLQLRRAAAEKDA